MKNIVFMALFATLLALSPLTVNQAQALSCLSIDMYLKDVVGKEEIVIFEATTKDKIESENYTAEVLEVTKAKQGYVENNIFVYHEKSTDWGYLCNNGPKDEGSKGLYVVGRSDNGKYNVHQRLELNDPLITALDADLKSAEIEGGIGELSKTDRMNQIVTTVNDFISEIKILLAEYIYWKTN
jgi:hypothetical protein